MLLPNYYEYFVFNKMSVLGQLMCRWVRVSNRYIWYIWKEVIRKEWDVLFNGLMTIWLWLYLVPLVSEVMCSMCMDTQGVSWWRCGCLLVSSRQQFMSSDLGPVSGWRTASPERVYLLGAHALLVHRSTSPIGCWVCLSLPWLAPTSAAHTAHVRCMWTSERLFFC